MKSDLEIARNFAAQHDGVLAWRKRDPSGQFHYWFVRGKMDEYGIEARKVIRNYLRSWQSGAGIQTDEDGRIERVLDQLKEFVSA